MLAFDQHTRLFVGGVAEADFIDLAVFPAEVEFVSAAGAQAGDLAVFPIAAAPRR